MVVYFVHARVKGGLALCSIGGQLIIPVWGRVAGRHHPALCCCQESFTRSSSSPNGTSESIKTIITASPESKEIILGCQEKHSSSVWSYLLKDLLDMHSPDNLLRPWYSVFVLCECNADYSRVALQILHCDLSWQALAVVWWEPEIYVCVEWGSDLINNHVSTPITA